MSSNNVSRVGKANRKLNEDLIPQTVGISTPIDPDLKQDYVFKSTKIANPALESLKAKK